MTHALLSAFDSKAIGALSPEHLEPTAIALATEIDRLEALLTQVQRRLQPVSKRPVRCRLAGRAQHQLHLSSDLCHRVAYFDFQLSSQRRNRPLRSASASPAAYRLSSTFSTIGSIRARRKRRQRT